MNERAAAEWLAARQPIYRWRKPRYQVRMLRDLAALMPEGACRVLDVGAGSGLIGEAIASLLPGKSVVGVDVERRVLPGLRIPFLRFDGRRLPFADGAFDCALFCNVLHHVGPEARPALLAEALRVTGGGPLVIKDHLPASTLDHWKLAWLDFLGNVPFGGMVSAKYLEDAEWRALAEGLGCRSERIDGAGYRGALSAWLLPNRLEFCLRLVQSRRQT